MVRALYVGRFQPFHLGHLEVVKSILLEEDEVVIAVGSAQESGTAKNPFSAEERVLMIRRSLEEAGITPDKYHIVPIPDAGDDVEWVNSIKQLCPSFQVLYANEGWVCNCFKNEQIETKKPKRFEREKYSATNVRNKIINGEDWASLVPPAVYQTIQEINGLDRMGELKQSQPTLCQQTG